MRRCTRLTSAAAFRPVLEQEQERDFELVALFGGVQSLRSIRHGQTFHPVVGPMAEAGSVHLGGTRLVERANAWSGDGPFIIWDVGLGAAANATAAVAALEAGYAGCGDVHMLSFDSTFGALDFALAHQVELGYPAAYAGSLKALRQNRQTVVPLAGGRSELRWDFLLGDFPALLASAVDVPAPHAIFFDPYSTTANPRMWTVELFTLLSGRLRPDRPCLMTTYTRSTAVRVTLLLAGFYVGIGPATGEKNETTVAANSLSLLTQPLGSAWLEKKVLASTNAAPLRAAATPLQASRISEADYNQLRLHLQFR